MKSSASLYTHGQWGGGGQTSKGWCRKTRYKAKQHQTSVPQLKQLKEVASYSLFGESQLIVGHFELLFKSAA